MLWLIIQMGSLLGLAALFGTIIGWGSRGILLKGRTRRAMVERDVAQTELDQARAELDGLYAAQKSGVAAAAEAGDAALKNELQEREEKVHSLTSALAASQQQLEKLKEMKASGVPLSGEPRDSAVSTTPPAQASDDRFDAPIHRPSADLEWRNRYLESRVRVLESKMTALSADLEAASAPVELPMPEEAPDAIEPVVAASADHEVQKLSWLNGYLSRRAAFMAAHPIEDRGSLYASPTVETPAVSDTPEVDDLGTQSGTDVDAPPADAQGDAQTTNGATGEMEQELARLRWRNRYLEGRLAYVEGDVDRSEDAVQSGRSVNPGDVEASHSATVAEPPMIERPDDDGDDLTQIRGVSSELKRALNDIGVWRFTQIASWSKEHVAWVAEHLSGDASANYQDWVEQADVLAKGGGSA
ncbi:MAG: hypothetical protein AAFY34_05805 [Pseudomonadota bacterium]